jgi:D-alanyl-lipoteichoic acid acyltransferase DltB (MBOAT superfamily)
VLFNSFEFVAFLVIVLLLYQVLGHRNQNRMLLAASYVFYGWWDWRFLSLIAISTVVDYFCALAIARQPNSRGKRRYLQISLFSNLGILGFFKYFDFFITSAAELLETLGLHASLPTLSIILPVGISFYTFQTMGYTIDVYRGNHSPAKRFDSFALYVAYFPQLVAGPIERSQSLLPQIENPRKVDSADWNTGLQLIVFGFFKKLCIADGVAPYVDRAFANPTELTGPEVLLSVYLFALQIYGDFSGYTNIARGVSRLFGIRLTINFRQPYLSSTISEFWRRWHISLSSWLRDYLYIPLGGNRLGPLLTYRNLGITMLLGGLWHGASWNFVIWGGMHGILLALHRAWNPDRRAVQQPSSRRRGIGHWLRIVMTFHLVCLLWIFFRAPDLATSIALLSALSGPWEAPPLIFSLTALTFLVVNLLLDLAAREHPEALPIPENWPAWRRGLLFAVLIAAISFIGETDVRPFIYFQF